MDKRNDPRYNFAANPTLDELIAQQGKGPITDVKPYTGISGPRTNPTRTSWRPSMNGAATRKPTPPHDHRRR